jgi:hypothetical protein
MSKAKDAAAIPAEPKTHNLTDVQADTLRPLMVQVQQLQSTIGLFLGHIVREAGLPKEGNWQLGYDQKADRPILVSQPQ